MPRTTLAVSTGVGAREKFFPKTMKPNLITVTLTRTVGAVLGDYRIDKIANAVFVETETRGVLTKRGVGDYISTREAESLENRPNLVFTVAREN